MVGDLDREFNRVRVLESKPIYDKHGLVIIKDILEFADGSTWEYVYFKSRGTVAVAALTEEGKLILTRQYRHPLRKVVYELPGGAIEEGETPSQAALRELKEETGYTAESLELIGRFSRGPGSQAVVEIFLAKNVKRINDFDSNEILEVELMDLNLLLQRILKGECFDAALIIAVLLISTRNR
ncbi:ADP-ribose pyrophosphatase [Candidatus Bathyarchaeota archaeon]|nr:MAG: ADP-ribose pyrophosphatase [Candidatus Bathyarchaeota archaeon]